MEWEYVVLGIAAFCGAFVDAIVGGGGLIQIPALFSTLPNVASATLLGTNKMAGFFGTSYAAYNYAKTVKINWRILLPASLAAFLLSFCGAIAVTYVPPTYLRKVLPFVLCAIAIYTFSNKNLGQQSTHSLHPKHEFLWMILVGAVIGFYDGFFGPGTGSFFVFIFVKIFGYDFLQSSASAKVLNASTNIAALLWFGLGGHILWQLGAVMAVCAVCGAILGSRLAIKQGAGFVRKIFLWVVALLIVKTSYDAYYEVFFK